MIFMPYPFPIPTNPGGPFYTRGGPFAVSQQFGANQTDLFIVDQAGQLMVFSVVGTGHWTATAISPVGLFKPDAAVAASQQSGVSNQTDVFVVDKNGLMNYFWVQGSGAWNGPHTVLGQAENLFPSGANLAACPQFGTNQTDVFLVDKNGQLNFFWVDDTNTLKGPTPIGPGGITEPGAAVAACQQGSANQTDVFFINKIGILVGFWVQGAGSWNGPMQIYSGVPGTMDTFPYSAEAPPGAHLAACPLACPLPGNFTAVFYINNNGEFEWFLFEGELNAIELDIDALPIGGPYKAYAPPGAPLATFPQGQSQTSVYFIGNNGQLNIIEVEVQGTSNIGGIIYPNVNNANNGVPTAAGPVNMALPGSVVAVSPQFGAGDQVDVFFINESVTNSWPTVLWVDGSGNWNGPDTLVTQV